MTAPNDPSNAPAPGNAPKRRIAVGQVIGAVLLILVLVFIFENTNTVEVRLIFPQVHVSLAVALLIAAVLGGLAVLLIQVRRRRRD